LCSFTEAIKTDLLKSKNRKKLLEDLRLIIEFLNHQYNLITYLIMKKVTGLGGVFFKCDNPKNMNDWYSKNLGLATSDYGAVFRWRDADDPSKEGATAWCAFPQNAKNFNPSTKQFMINYRVENLVELVDELKKEDVNVIDEIADSDYGKFVHILDPEGNIIELWEPKD